MRKLAIGLALASTALATPSMARDGQWYVGVDGGAMIVEDLKADVGPVPLEASLDTDTGYDFGAVVGYDFGGFRLEAETSYRNADVTGTSSSAALMPSGPGAGLQAAGSYATAGGANALSFMLNGVLDFGKDDGLQGFVDAMRNGFRLTETRLLKVEKELEERYKDVTLEGVSFIGNVLDEIDAACTENQAGQLSCTSGSNRAFTWTAEGNGSFSWATNRANLGRTSEGTVVGSLKNGMNTLTVNGSIVKGTTELATMKNLEVSFLDKGGADYRGLINGAITANSSKNLVVTLEFDGVELKSVPRSNTPTFADLTFKGGLSLEANNGDKLSGTVDLTGIEYSKSMDFYSDYQQFITAGSINLKAVTMPHSHACWSDGFGSLRVLERDLS